MNVNKMNILKFFRFILKYLHLGIITKYFITHIITIYSFKSAFYRIKIMVPIFVLYLYFYEKEKKKRTLCLLSNYSLYISILTLISIIFFRIKYSNIKFRDVFGFEWQFISLIEWVIAYIIAYIYFNYKTKDSFSSFIFSILVIIIGGWLYEIVVYHPIKCFFHLSFPILINSSLLSIFFLFKLLRDYKYKINLVFIISLINYFLFSIIYYNVGFKAHIIPKFIYRIPTIVLLITLPSGIKKGELNFL